MSNLKKAYVVLSNPAIVKEKGIVIDDNPKTYSLTYKTNVPLLGEVTIESLYFEGEPVAKPVMLVTEEQFSLLRQQGIRVASKKRDNPGNDQVWIVFVDSPLVETISSSSD